MNRSDRQAIGNSRHDLLSSVLGFDWFFGIHLFRFLWVPWHPIAHYIEHSFAVLQLEVEFRQAQYPPQHNILLRCWCLPKNHIGLEEFACPHSCQCLQRCLPLLRWAQGSRREKYRSIFTPHVFLAQYCSDPLLWCVDADCVRSPELDANTGAIVIYFFSPSI